MPLTSPPLDVPHWSVAGEGARESARGGQGGLSVPKAGELPTRLVVDSPIGSLCLEASADGLVALSWTRTRLPTLPVRGASAKNDQARGFLRQGAAWLRAYFSGTSPLPPLPPLVPQGTAFQKAVWRQLVAIRPGTTTTYGEIARGLRKPGASRAVGQAVGANPLPIVIPCHRVLAAGGKLGGYSSGLRRKRSLLAHEGLTWRS